MDLLSLGASLASQIQKAIHAELACETTPGLFNLTHSPIPQHVTASEPRDAYAVDRSPPSQLSGSGR